MAKNTAKANVKSNVVRIQRFWLITIACNVIHIASIIWSANFGMPSLWQVIGLLFWLSQEVLAMLALQSRARPTYDSQGNVEDCVNIADPSQLGLASYAQDLLWVCWVLQVLSHIGLSEYVSLLYLVVPGYGIVKGWNGLVSPMLAQRSMMLSNSENPAEVNVDPATRLARRRAEARGSTRNHRRS